MIMNNDTSFTVLDEDFRPVRHLDLNDKETREAIYFKCQLVDLTHTLTSR